MLDDQRPRRVIPRWRSSWLTAETVESWSQIKPNDSRKSSDIEDKLKEFANYKTVPVAAELMFLASSIGDNDAAKMAAQIIVNSAQRIGSSSLVKTAKLVLGSDDRNRTLAHSRDFVRDARKLLDIDYRNPVLLIDIARELTSRGHEESARRYIRTAAALAPSSRFIVRAAARFYLHVGEHDVAHDLLKRSPLLLSDSWVQASEIAVATLRGRTSNLVKRFADSLASVGDISHHLSELASAVATIELQNGANKRAKKLFQKALLHPNDNSLAQAEWAASKLNLVVDDTTLKTPFSFEANSYNAYRKLNISESISCAEKWAIDEPFASRPFNALCFLYSIEGRFSEAKKAAEDAVRVDEEESLPTSLNLIFSQIQAGDLDAAYLAVLRLSKHSDAKKFSAHILANAGALAYATGEHKLGGEFYQRAIQAARVRSDRHTEALATAFYARTAIASADEKAEEILKDAVEKVERLPSPGAIYMLRGLVGSVRRSQLDATAASRVAKRRWEWDVATNTLRAID